MKLISYGLLLAMSATGAMPLSASGQSSPNDGAQCLVTLGTAGGPIAYAERSQPANLLLAGSQRILVDVGDGAVERLAALRLQPGAIDAVFISHLHMDHIGGLQGLIGLRWMTAAKPLTVYGPPGTRELVAGIISSMQPSVRAGLGEGPGRPTDGIVRVIELDGGSDVVIGDVRVRAVRNTHFVGEGDVAKPGPVSLSYRFDRNGSSIGYTGDTGESEAVAGLFRGVDVLVSEVIDLPRVMEMVRKNNPGSAQNAANLERHLGSHHLTPVQVGALAWKIGAGSVVLTHLSIVGPTADTEPTLLSGVRTAFTGPVTVARDLSRFCAGRPTPN